MGLDAGQLGGLKASSFSPVPGRSLCIASRYWGLDKVLLFARRNE